MIQFRVEVVDVVIGLVTHFHRIHTYKRGIGKVSW